MLLNVLRDSFTKTRADVCRGCKHALGQPRVTDRKLFCEKLFNGKWGDRGQPAYLPKLVASQIPQCPLDLHARPVVQDYHTPADPPPDRAKAKNAIFHELWAEIHDPSRHWTPFWWGTIRHKLPCGECKQELGKYVKANPIPFGDDASCHAWGSALHDAVNERLGKPRFTLVLHPDDDAVLQLDRTYL